MTRDHLSRLLDAELDPSAVGSALRNLEANPESREAVTVYQIIGDALRGRAVEDDGYSLRIIAALARARG